MAMDRARGRRAWLELLATRTTLNFEKAHIVDDLRMTRLSLRSVALGTLIGFLGSSSVYAQLHWTQANPSPTGNAYRDVVHANGMFVAVADKGAIATSSDGRHWQARESGTDDSLQAVIYADGHFVAAGLNGTIATSDNGMDWDARSSGATFYVGNLVYGNGTYVLGGYSSTFLTSHDGVAWTPHTLGAGCMFNGYVNGGHDYGRIAYAHGQFVAAYGNCVLTSTDGVEWTRLPFNDSPWKLSIVNDAFLVVHDSQLAQTSADGIHWTALNGPNEYPSRMECAPSVGCYGFYPGDIYTTLWLTFAQSVDGADWQFRNIRYTLPGGSIDAPLNAMTFADGTFVGVGDAGAIIYSNDGSDWSSATDDLPGTLRGIAYGAATYVAVGDRGAVTTTADGVHWTSVSPPTTEDLQGIDFADGRFVAVGSHGTVVVSQDGTGWSARTSGDSHTLHDVAFGNGTYVAVGAGGTVLRSVDTNTWQSVVSGTTETLRAITFAAGRFAAVGDHGVALTSQNGIAWTVAATGAWDDSLFAVAYGNGQFVALGAVARYSSDGIIWFTPNASLPREVLALAFGGGRFMSTALSFATLANGGFTQLGGSPNDTYLTVRGLVHGTAGWVAVGDSGMRRNSVDGETWTDEVPAPSRQSRLTGVAAGLSSFIAVGSDFTPLSSSPDIVLSRPAEGEWSAVPRGDDVVMTGVAAHGDRFVAVGVTGKATVLENGTRTVHDVGIGRYLSAVVFVNDRFLAFGNSEVFAASADGATWSAQVFPSPYPPYAVAYGNGTYVAAAADGLFSSPDANEWTLADTETHRYRTIAFGNGTFVALGADGVIISPDGIAWSNVCPTTDIASIIFDGSKFVAIGSSAWISTNGREWRQGFLHSRDIYSIAYLEGRYVAVGESGRISESEDDAIFSTGNEGITCPVFP